MVSTRTLGLTSKPGANYERVLHDDTRKEMERLVPIVKAMTGAGTGFRLKGPTAVGPICAYIASERLGNNDFSKESARKASCLNPKTFQETLATIELVLSTHDKTSNEDSGAETVTYESLVGDYDFEFAEFMTSCMQRAEEVILNDGSLKTRIAPPSAVARVTIFMWVCGGFGTNIDEIEVVKRYRLSEKDIGQVETAIHESCKTLKRTIRQEWRAIHAQPRKASGASTSSTKHAASPTRPPNNRVAASQTPNRQAKAMVAPRSTRPRDEDAMEIDETPAKRRRASPSKVQDDVSRNAYSAFQAALTTPSRPNPSLKAALEASSSKLTSDLLHSQAEVPQSDYESTATTEEPLEGVHTVAETESSDAEIGDLDASSEILEPSVPMTPRHPFKPSRSALRDGSQTSGSHVATPTRKTPAAKGPSPRKASKAMTEQEEIYEEGPRERRHRPILLSQRQWFMADVREEADWEVREERMREWMEARGSQIPLLAGGA